MLLSWLRVATVIRCCGVGVADNVTFDEEWGRPVFSCYISNRSGDVLHYNKFFQEAVAEICINEGVVLMV